MPAPKIEILEDRLLLVEGRDELNLLGELIKACFNYKPGIQVLDIGGKTTLGRNLKTVHTLAPSRPSLRTIGIVRDADKKPVDSFKSVCDSVKETGYMPPSTHAEFSDASPSIGVFIVPDGSSLGAIETICRRSVQGEVVARCVEEYMDCLRTHDALKSEIPDKTFAHAYLAALRDPVARVGEGAKQGVWDFQSPAFDDLRKFVCDLAAK